MKKIINFKNILVLISVFTFISCEIEPLDSEIDLNDFQNQINPSNPVGTALFKADFDGLTWTAESVAAQVGGDYITIGGIKGNNDEGFGFIIEANSVGSYPANDNLLTYAPASSEYGWWSVNSDNPTADTGSITITNIDTVNNTISGTFTFTGYWSDLGVTNIAPKQFTNGVFENIPYTDYQEPGADTFYAKVNGIEFVDNDILVVSVNQFLGIGAKNAAFESITVSVTETLGVGTYPITGNNATDVVQATYQLDDNTSLQAVSGQISILSKTVDRITGTFNFVCNDGLTVYNISDGAFDVTY